MLYLANACSPAIRAAMTTGGLRLGQMCTPAEGRAPLPGVAWAADNGCYGNGWPGERRWLRWLEQHAVHAGRCLFATAPDVVGDAEATLDRSIRWLAVIRELGYPAALVAQDGLEDLPVPWTRIDVLFLGASTAWKLGPHATALTAAARRRGIGVHMGRVNSQARYRHAARIGCASVDGTCLIYAPDRNLTRLRRWTTDHQSRVTTGAAATATHAIRR
jgi:hypothetical protein